MRRRFMGRKRSVYIQDVNGRLYTRGEWMNLPVGTEATGVAVLTDKCEFVISKNDSPTNLEWGGFGVGLYGVGGSTDSTEAKTDYKGSENTDRIIGQLGSGKAPAAEYCRSVLFGHGKKGYLGSFGEWEEACKNKAEVDACMSLIGGTSIKAEYPSYWTSTQHSVYDSWSVYFNGTGKGNCQYHDKDLCYRVRAFAPL